MAVDLIYKHQQKTYDLMNESLEKNGRAAYVYPTGCGKTFPALKYIEDNSGNSAIIVVPSNFIKKQYEKNIKKYVENGAERLKNGSIKIATYQDRHFKLKDKQKKVRDKIKKILTKRKTVLSKRFGLSKIFMPEFDSDIVIFDEIHRMGAAEWEKTVDQIIKGNPKRKVIGMSATPERTDKRNMAYEKFGDDVVYEMSLTEALSGEKEGEVLLKSPNYVRVVSLLRSELPKYEEQIELIEDEEKKEKCLRAYQRLDTIVSNSPDIQDIIAAGMKKINGKYIIFCKDRDDMFDKIEHANEIFGKVNSKINIDYVITKKSGEEDTKGKTKVENDRTLEEFETRENGDGLNLLFCVDMLNEGVHLEGIDGEVLFDLTKSPILYKQRIGRVLSLDKNCGEAVIIDASNNWIAQIETYREIESAIQAGHQIEREDEEKDWNSLKLLPEELELIEILREIGEELKYNNKFDFDEFIEWLEFHDGKLPRGNISKNKRPFSIKEMNAVQKQEKRLRNSWNKSIEKKILEENIGKNIEEVPKEYREKIQILRDYGLGLKEKTIYEKIIEWLEFHDGNLPRKEIFLNGKKILFDNMSKNEQYETNLRNRWNKSKEKEVLKKYEGRSLEDIPEEYREKIKVLREFGLGISTYEEIIEWLENHDGILPRGGITIDGKKILFDNMSKNEQYETNLRHRWDISKEKEVLKEYEGRPLEDIPEEYREKVKALREFGLGILEEKKVYEKIIEWLENHDGKLPRGQISINNRIKTVEEMTAEEHEEFILRDRWKGTNEYLILNKYIGKELEEVPEEYREKVKELRKFGLGLQKRTTYEEIIEWLKLHEGQLPTSSVCREISGQKRLLTNSEMTEEEKYEVNLRSRWKNTRERKILDQYKGMPLEEIPEEYKEKVSVLRGYGLGLTKEEELKRKMQKAVGKQVADNEETRQELEGPDKSLSVEDDKEEK